MAGDVLAKNTELAAEAERRRQENARLLDETLRRETPAMHGWIQAMREEFGEPAAIRITCEGKSYRRGQFMTAQEYDDFNERRTAWATR